MINPISFGISNTTITNSLKNKTEKYYKDMFSDIERSFTQSKQKEDFYNPRTHKITTIYPSMSSNLASVRQLGGKEELRLTKIQSTNGLTRMKWYTINNNSKSPNKSIDNYTCEIWDPERGFINVKNL